MTLGTHHLPPIFDTLTPFVGDDLVGAEQSADDANDFATLLQNHNISVVMQRIVESGAHHTLSVGCQIIDRDAGKKRIDGSARLFSLFAGIRVEQDGLEVRLPTRLSIQTIMARTINSLGRIARPHSSPTHSPTAYHTAPSLLHPILPSCLPVATRWA